MIIKTLILALLLMLIVGKTDAQPFDSLTINNLRLELEEMYDADQSKRILVDSLIQHFGVDSDEVKELWKTQSEIDHKNINRLREIIEVHGWPKRSVYGKKASSAAFLVIQHADHETQKQYLPMVKVAFEDEELDGQYLALLQDRILVRGGKKQIYGTQLSRNPETNELELHPIEDEVNVDKRRAEMGMMPLAEYLKLFDMEYTPPEN